MRIAYVVQHFTRPQEAGGARPYETAKLLAESGHDVHLFAARACEDRDSRMGWASETLDGFTLHTTAVPYSNSMGWFERVRAFAAFASRASREARKQNADVVLASSTPLTIAIPGMIASHGRCAFVFEVRDLWPEMPIAFGALDNRIMQRIAFGLARAAYKRAERIVALSEGMKAGIVEHGIDSGKIVVIPNGCDIPSSANDTMFTGFEDERLHGRQKVVFMGSMGPLYDLDWVVSLAERLHELNENAAVCLIGTGRDRNRLVDSADRNGTLGRSVYFFDPVPRRTVFSVLAQASVVLSVAAPVPGIGDNSANKFFDGLAAGRPVAVNYGGWQASLLEEHHAGLSLPRDIEHAAQLLANTLADPKELDSMGRASLYLAQSKFDRRDLVNQLERTLVSAVEAHDRSNLI